MLARVIIWQHDRPSAPSIPMQFKTNPENEAVEASSSSELEKRFPRQPRGQFQYDTRPNACANQNLMKLHAYGAFLEIVQEYFTLFDFTFFAQWESNFRLNGPSHRGGAVDKVARASTPASSSGVPPGDGPAPGGETPPKPAGEDACATLWHWPCASGRALPPARGRHSGGLLRRRPF
jgi:hypothetical protein